MRKYRISRSAHRCCPGSTAFALLFAVLCIVFCREAGAGQHPFEANGYVNTNFDSNGLDDINLFNGNLILNIPLGPSYQVGPVISYQLKLTYNSKLWTQRPVSREYFPYSSNVSCVGGRSGSTNLGKYCEYSKNVLSADRAYGLGWQLSFGRIRIEKRPFTAGAAVGYFMAYYVDASGAEHRLYRTPWTTGTFDDNDWIFHTRDGSNLRVDAITEQEDPTDPILDPPTRNAPFADFSNVTGWIVRSPNGVSTTYDHRVEGVSSERWLEDGEFEVDPATLDSRIERDGWYPTQIEDQYDNIVTIRYRPFAPCADPQACTAAELANGMPWEIESIGDTTGRAIDLAYASAGAGKRTVTLSLPIRPAETGGQDTTDVTLHLLRSTFRGERSTDPESLNVTTDFLTGIDFGGRGTYEFAYRPASGPTPSCWLGPSEICESAIETSGALYRVGLPTGGRIWYRYEETEVDANGYSLCEAQPPWMDYGHVFCGQLSRFPGVASRTETRKIQRPGSSSWVEDNRTTRYERTLRRLDYDQGGIGDPVGDDILPFMAVLVTRPPNVSGLIRQELSFFGAKARNDNTLDQWMRIRGDSEDDAPAKNYGVGQLIREEIYESSRGSGDGGFGGGGLQSASECDWRPYGGPAIPNLIEHVTRFPHPLDLRTTAAEPPACPVNPFGVPMPLALYGCRDPLQPTWRPGRLLKATSYIYAYDDVVEGPGPYAESPPETLEEPSATQWPERNARVVQTIEQYFSDGTAADADGDPVSRLSFAIVKRRIKEGDLRRTMGADSSRYLGFGLYPYSDTKVVSPALGGRKSVVEQLDPKGYDPSAGNEFELIYELPWRLGERRATWVGYSEDSSVEPTVGAMTWLDYSANGFLGSIQSELSLQPSTLSAPTADVRTQTFQESVTYSGLVAAETLTQAGSAVTYTRTHEYPPSGADRPCGMRKMTTMGGVPQLDQDPDCLSGKSTATWDIAGVKTDFDFDELGRVSLVTPGQYVGYLADAIASISYSLPTEGRIPTNPFAIAYPLEATGRATIVETPLESGAPQRTTNIFFDGFGQVTLRESELPSGDKTYEVMSYGPDGQLFAASNPVPYSTYTAARGAAIDGALQLTPNQACGRPSNGITGVIPGSCSELDALGRPVRIESADGSVVVSKYFSAQQASPAPGEVVFTDVKVVTQCNVDGRPTRSVFVSDGFGRLREVIEAKGGLLPDIPGSAQSAIAQRTSYSYDLNDKLVEVRQPQFFDGTGIVQIRSFSYDALGRQLSEKHPEQDVLITFERDALGNVTKQTEKLGTTVDRVLETEYDPAGRPLRVSRTDGDAKQLLKELAYGTANTAEAGLAKNKLRTAKRYQRELQGAVAGITDVPVVEEQFRYTGRAGRLDQTGLKVLSTPASWFPAMDTNRYFTNETDVDSMGALSSRTYGEVVNLLGTNAMAARTEQLTAKRGVNITSASGAKIVASASSFWPNGEVGAFTSVAGLLTTTWTQDETTGTSPLPTFLSRPTSIAFDPISSNGERILGPYSYDGAGNVLAIGQSYPSGAERKLSDSEDTFEYDGLSRLTLARLALGPTERYEFDRWSNLTRKAPAEAAASPEIHVNHSTNRLETNAATGSVAEYDHRGNLTRWGESRYQWSEDDRMIVFERLNPALNPSDSESLAERWVYLYSASGERVARVEVVSFGDATRDFGQRAEIVLRDPANQVASVLATANSGPLELEADYFRLWGRLIAKQDFCSTSWAAFGTDHLGTPRVTVAKREATGATVYVRYLDLMPYGDEIPGAERDEEKFRFTGHERDSESGLDYMHARFYNNSVGRFLSVDPLRIARGSLFSFAEGNPLRFIDPSGMAGEESGVRAPQQVDCGSGRPCEKAAKQSAEDQRAVLSAKDVVRLALSNSENVPESLLKRAIAVLLSVDSSDAEAAQLLAKFYAAVDSLQTTPGPIEGIVTFFSGGVAFGSTKGVLVQTSAQTSRLGASLASLNRQLTAEQISAGHAFGKHAAEFGFKSQAEFAAHIESVLTNPTMVRSLSGGRSAFWDSASKSVVIRDPLSPDGGTAFIPKKGVEYFLGLN